MYKPHRDYRFHYIHEVMHFIESRQCGDCAFKETDDPDMPMCLEVSGPLMLEEPVEVLDDRGDDGVVCTKYRNEVLAEEAHPSQTRLFEENNE